MTPTEVKTSVRRCKASAWRAMESVSLATLKSFSETTILVAAEISMTMTPHPTYSIGWG